MKNQLEIHHVSVSGGDATIIAVYDPNKLDEKNVKPTSLVLVDAGNSMADMKTIVEYADIEFGQKKFTHVILSHAHKDHLGALDQSKIELEVAYHGTYYEYDAILAAKKVVHVADLLEKNECLDLNHNVKIYFVCLDGIPIFKDYVHPEFNPTKEEIKKLELENQKFINKSKDDNDYSLAFILNFGDFNYFSAGDLSGSNAGGYINVELELLKLLKNNNFPKTLRKVNAMKATHHGSRYSNFGKNHSKNEVKNNLESPLLKHLNPEHLIVTCNNRIPLPHFEFFGRVEAANNKAQIYLVNEFSRCLEEADKGKYLKLTDEWKDMIATTKDEIELEIQIDKKKSKLKYLRNYKPEDIIKPSEEKESKKEISSEEEEDKSPQVKLPLVKIVVPDFKGNVNVLTDKMAVYLVPDSKRKIKTSGIPKKLDKDFLDKVLVDEETKYPKEYRGKPYFEVLMMMLEIDLSNRLEIANTYKANSAGNNYIVKTEDGIKQGLFVLAENLLKLGLNSIESRWFEYDSTLDTYSRFYSLYKKVKKFMNKSLAMQKVHKEKKRKKLEEKNPLEEHPTKKKKKPVKKL